MAEDREQPEPKDSEVPAPARRRAPSDVVSTWLESQRRMDRLLKPPVLRLIGEQQAWLKAMSGAAAMPSDVIKLLGTRELQFAGGVLSDFERTRRILGGFNPALDASRQLRALTAAGSFPAFQEATLAHERIARLVAPMDISAITRDLTGVSDAVTSVASMISSPVVDVGRDISAIASSALGSWRSYVDALPSALDASDLFHVQAAARGVLGVTASSAILLGDDEAVEVAEEYELAPAEMRNRMRVGLRQIDPGLVVRLDGAWDAVTHAGPDSVSQAANSAVELIDWTLRLACDAAALDAWVAVQPKPALYRDASDRPTRQAKIRYLLRKRDFEAEFVAATARNLNALRDELETLKHGHGEHDVHAVARLLPSVEAVLFLIVV